MKTPEQKKKTNWKKISTIAAIFVCMLLTAIPFINSNTESDVVVYMSINPQIHLELNKDGKINRLVADNEDGKELLDDYKYRGKSVAVILSELIDRAEKLKYLSEGGDIHITVEAVDEFQAKNVEIDLSQALKETYIEKYQIKIKANEEPFREIDDVLNSADRASSAETEQVTSESMATDSFYGTTEYYTEATKATQSTTAPTTESQKTSTAPSENSKPTVKPTEMTKPSEPPTEATTEPTSESEPSSGEDDDTDDDSEEDDFYWPWWPWPFAE